jgi:transposase-like protein
MAEGLVLVKGKTMAVLPVRCPSCQSEEVLKGGKTDTGNQRSRCPHPACAQHSFVRDSAYQGRSPQIKPLVVEMRRNGSGVRDTARVLWTA